MSKASRFQIVAFTVFYTTVFPDLGSSWALCRHTCHNTPLAIVHLSAMCSPGSKAWTSWWQMLSILWFCVGMLIFRSCVHEWQLTSPTLTPPPSHGYKWHASPEAVWEVEAVQDYLGALAAHDMHEGTATFVATAFDLFHDNITMALFGLADYDAFLHTHNFANVQLDQLPTTWGFVIDDALCHIDSVLSRTVCREVAPWTLHLTAGLRGGMDSAGSAAPSSAETPRVQPSMTSNSGSPAPKRFRHQDEDEARNDVNPHDGSSSSALPADAAPPIAGSMLPHPGPHGEGPPGEDISDASSANSEPHPFRGGAREAAPSTPWSAFLEAQMGVRDDLEPLHADNLQEENVEPAVHAPLVPIHPPALENTIVNPLADGACVYACIAAVFHPHLWAQQARHSNGLARDPLAASREQRETMKVKSLVRRTLERSGQPASTERLGRSGELPGFEEFTAVAQVLGGGLEVVSMSSAYPQRPLHYGKGPLLARIGFIMQADGSGHSAPHYVLLQCWPDPASTSDGPHDLFTHQVLQRWEPETFRRMYEEGMEEEEFEVDEIPCDESIRDAGRRVLFRFEETIGEWPTPPADRTRRALLVVALAIEDDCVVWNKNNNILLTRLFALLYDGQARAHPDGVYQKKNGAFKKVESIDERELRGLEDALGLARNYFLALMKSNVAQEWTAVFQYLKGYHQSPGSRRKTTSADFKPPENQDQFAMWALDIAKALAGMGGHYVNKAGGAELVDCFGTWFKEERPEATPLICYTDAMFEIDNTKPPGRGRFKQVDKANSPDCYTYIPVSMHVKVDEEVARKIRLMLCTTFADNPEARFMDAAMEALSFYGIEVPHTILVFQGDGGDGKSMRTLLRENVFGGRHKTLGADVLQVPEEWRKQACNFGSALGITIQECQGGAPLQESWAHYYLALEASDTGSYSGEKNSYRCYEYLCVFLVSLARVCL